MKNFYILSFSVVEKQTTVRYERWFYFWRKPVVEVKDTLVRKQFVLTKSNGDFILAHQNEMGKLFREMVPKGGHAQIEYASRGHTAYPCERTTTTLVRNSR